MRVNWKAGGPKDGPGSLPAGSGPLPGSFPGPDTAGGSKVPTLRLRYEFHYLFYSFLFKRGLVTLCYFLFCKAFSGSDSGCRAHIDFAFRRGYFVCHVGVDEKLVGEEKKPEELRSRAWPSQGFYGSITSFHT